MDFGGKIQMYPLLRVAVAFALGIAIGGTIGCGVPPWIWLCGMVLCLALSFMWHSTRHMPVLHTTILYITILLSGTWRADSDIQTRSFKYTPTEETLNAVVTKTPPPHPTSRPYTLLTRYELTIASGRFAGHNAYAYIPACHLHTGDGLTIHARILPPSGINIKETREKKTGHFNYARWLATNDIVARIYADSSNWKKAYVGLENISGTKRLTIHLAKYRDRLLSKMRRAGLPHDAYPVVAAMTLGDRQTLTKELRNTYSASGASHVLALSGLHIGIIYALLSAILVGRRHRTMMHAAVLTAVWGYVAMTGMSPSAVRSAVMCTLLTFGSLLSRQNNALNSLGTAAILILATSPLSLWDIGFQMSFLAMLGILSNNKRARQWLPANNRGWRRLTEWIVQTAVITVSAQIAVAPLAAYYFGRFPCYFILSSFVAIPLATLIIYSSILVFALSPLPAIQAVAAWTVGAETSTLNNALGWIAALPGAYIDNINISGTQLLLVYVLIVLGYILSGYIHKILSIRDFE